MSKLRQSTSILRNCYNSRGLGPYGLFGGTKNVVIQEDGTLWALIATNRGTIKLYRSTDDGFSWHMVNEDRFTSASLRGPNAGIQGSIHHITVFPNWDRIMIWFAGFNSVNKYDVAYAWADLSSDLANADWTDHTPLNIDDDTVKNGVFSLAYNSYYAFISYVNSTDNLCLSYLHAEDPATITNPITSPFTSFTWGEATSIMADEEGYLDILAIADTSKLYHTYYSITYGAWGTATLIDTAASGGSIIEPSISVDGYGNFLAAWGEKAASGSPVNLRYAISTDYGETWTVTDVAKESGNTEYFDIVKGQNTLRVDTIGGVSGGFMITYTMDASNNYPKSYIRQLTTTDGSTYTLGDQKLVGPVADDVAVVGAKFFRPPGATLLSLEDPSKVRLAFQLWEGDSALQLDTLPVHFDSETMEYSAYPNPLDTDAGSYTADTAGVSELLVNIEMVAGPSANIDFYDKGMTGRYTDLFMAAFDKLATECRVLQYEPTLGSQMSDITAYGEPTEHCVDIVWKPLSYAFPTPDLATAQQEDFVEQDIRKIYLRPNTHLSRTFLLNEGNFLKRTVWTVFYDGNSYEISQVVPHFMNNQICYYEANAYVIGPSRNPWSRIVLPSET